MPETDTPEPETKEKLVLSTSDAIELAKEFRATEGKKAKLDPLTQIPHSLLTAEHIKKYVLETGLISPFYTGGGKQSRLKKAAYEGRMGNAAYLYKDDHNPKRVLYPESDTLTVPANSIVYVECDLEFRLPEFIALRFNLQIQHVHRGLLLGTGPLVDPGFWGKLCIPLHNLTDQPYTIPRDVGLIWVEFTKTTSNIEDGEEGIGRPPLGSKEFWDITKFLSKASAQFNQCDPPIPLRSSLPEMFDNAVRQSKEANERAKLADCNSQKASAAAERLRNYGFWTAIGVAVAIVSLLAMLIALWVTFYKETRDYSKEVTPITVSVNDLQVSLGTVQSEIRHFHSEYLQRIEKLEIELQAVQNKYTVLNELVRKYEAADEK